ncbi:hypothetical protein BGW39_003800 [Mortierella sp. 14UC]|nr:hypothetical protein BGW39_003800 [Mortierella sp. 14UC]
MDEHQAFRLGNDTLNLAVRFDEARKYHYSRLKDIQLVFPDAALFKRRGVIIFFLEDENEVVIEPKRIMHYPGDIIEVITNKPEYTPLTPPMVHIHTTTISNPGVSGTYPSRATSSAAHSNTMPVLTPPPPPHHHDQRAYSAPSPPAPQTQTRAFTAPNAKPAVAPAGFIPQHRTQGSFSALQNYTPTSTSPPESEYGQEEISAITNTSKKMTFSPALRRLVDNANGSYDEDTQKISLTLTSSLHSRQFFGTLVREGRELKELDVALAWDFNAFDNEYMVTSTYRTEIAILRLDLRGTWDDNLARKGNKLKYGNLHTLLWNKTLKGLVFKNATYFGPRTNMPLKNKLYSNLRLLHFLVKIEPTSESQICTLIGACPNLLDLRLGTFLARGEMHPRMERVIGNLKKLKALHIYNTAYSSTTSEDDEAYPRWRTIPQSDKPAREIVRTGISVNQPHLQELIGRSCTMLEVLLLQYPMIQGHPLELRTSAFTNGSFSSFGSLYPKNASNPTAHKALGQPYTNLTHLDLQVVLSTDALSTLRQVVPQLSLTHLGVDGASKDLLHDVKYEILESISLTGLADSDLFELKKASLKGGKSWKLHTIRLRNIINITTLQFLLSLPMKRIFLSDPSLESLKETLANLDLSILEVLSIFTPEYDWSTEAILANQAAKFNTRMKVELAFPITRELRTEVYDKNIRPMVGTKQRLARERVEILPVFLQHERYIQGILPPYSVTK